MGIALRILWSRDYNPVGSATDRSASQLFKLHRTLAVALIGSLAVFSAQAQNGASLLAVESFAVPAGPLNNINDGSGWNGAWQVQGSNTNVPGYGVATSSPLSYSGISTTGGYAAGGCVYLGSGRLFDTSSGGAFASYLNNGLIGLPGQTIYFGVLMRQDVNADDEMSVTLHSNTPPWWVNTPGIAIGHFGSGSDTNGIHYWSLQMDGVIHQTTVPVVVGQPAFLVLQITFGTTTAVNLFVNPSMSSLPGTPDAQATTSNSMAFRSIAYYGGNNPGESSIDELRVSGSYGGLVSGSTPPPPTPTNLTSTAGNAQVALSWTPVSGASGYNVYMLVNGVGQLQSSPTASTFTDTGLVNDTVYTFYVVAWNASGTSSSSAQVTGVPRGPAPPPHPALGTNLSQVTDYGREMPFVDAFKSARAWIPQMQGMSWGQGPPLQVDSNGWITSLQTGQYAETIMFDNAIDDQADYPVGQYTLLYDGSGTLSFDLQSGTIVSQTPGRMVVNVPAGLNGIFLIESATDPTNPIRNIRFILPGFESTYQTQPFHPLFLQRLQSYEVLRFMEWTLTNGSTMQNWANRATPSDYVYWRGVPLEVCIQLANATNMKPWFNIPAQASDDYIRQFATLVSQQLKPGLTFYLEYSNETWNGSFSQSGYIQAQGQALGLGTNPTTNGAYYTAYRSVQMFNIFQSVFGGHSRFIRVIASQSANSWLSDQTLSFQNAFASADVLAIAPYFNCSDTATGGFGILGDPSTASQVAAMTVDQVDDIQLAHINNCTMQQMQSNAAVASNYGLKMVAYEGGESLVGYNGAQNNTALTATFKAVSRGSRMNSLYATYLQNWIAAGGDMFVHYSDVSAYSMYGSFGSMEYQDQDPTTAPKYQALMTFASQHQ
jgi:hypothetical protein